MILVIDNYGSFSYNIVQYLREMDAEVQVRRNDEVSVTEIVDLSPQAIVLSPGTGLPEQSGVSWERMGALAGILPILGIGLGHHIVAEYYGAKIVAAPQLLHGKTVVVQPQAQGIFAGMQRDFKGACYHSLVVDPESIPADLQVLGQAESGEIMALSHKKHPTIGLQFHPEAIMTPMGKKIFRNFLQIMAEYSASSASSVSPASSASSSGLDK